MTFHEIADRFEHAESGSDSFKRLARDTLDLMKADPLNAGLYFVVGVAARSYVNRYEDQGITPEFADRSKSVLVAYNRKLVEALAMEPSARWRLLGELVIDYEWNVAEF